MAELTIKSNRLAIFASSFVIAGGIAAAAMLLSLVLTEKGVSNSRYQPVVVDGDIYAFDSWSGDHLLSMPGGTVPTNQQKSL
jgi:hypothetical protein